jgi:hypothetical protein
MANGQKQNERKGQERTNGGNDDKRSAPERRDQGGGEDAPTRQGQGRNNQNDNDRDTPERQAPNEELFSQQDEGDDES